MFYSVYSRLQKKGDGNGGYITYVSGDNSLLNRAVGLISVDMMFEHLELLIDSGHKFSMKTNAFHEMLEVSMSRPSPRWEDVQYLQVVGSSPMVCLADLLALYYMFFATCVDWVSEAVEIDGQDPDENDPVINNLPPDLRSMSNPVELPQLGKKGGKKSNVQEDQIPF